MSGEKTELPTPRRLREAREKGQVPNSKDLTSAILLVTATGILAIGGGLAAIGLAVVMKNGIAEAGSFRGDLDVHFAVNKIVEGVKTMGLVLAPLFFAMFIMAFGVSYLQVGSLFAAEKLKPDFKKINPIEGFKQKFFKARAYIELVKTIFKMAVTVMVIWNLMKDSVADLLKLVDQPVSAVAIFTSELVFRIGIRVGLVFLALGAADYFLQKFLHINDLKMSKQEIIDEYKKTEGDPHIKYQRRHLHQQLLNETDAKAVKKSSAVVTNPTHLAIAIQYDPSTMQAPIVAAKGADLMAQHIRTLASDAGVPIIRDVPLARALYELEVEDEIPEKLYEAVAIVLHWALRVANTNSRVSS